jgi:hypothetical protein
METILPYISLWTSPLPIKLIVQLLHHLPFSFTTVLHYFESPLFKFTLPHHGRSIIPNFDVQVIPSQFLTPLALLALLLIISVLLL